MPSPWADDEVRYSIVPILIGKALHLKGSKCVQSGTAEIRYDVRK